MYDATHIDSQSHLCGRYLTAELAVRIDDGSCEFGPDRAGKHGQGQQKAE